MRPATKTEQQYLDLAAYYVERAMLCCEHRLWPEAEVNFGSALESLLRIRYRAKNLKFAPLIKRFDSDRLFDSLAAHNAQGKQCVTCLADKIRTLRNAVHPQCWRLIKQGDAEQARLTVITVFHVLAVCSTRIADFQSSPDTRLAQMENLGEPLNHRRRPASTPTAQSGRKL